MRSNRVRIKNLPVDPEVVDDESSDSMTDRMMTKATCSSLRHNEERTKAKTRRPNDDNETETDGTLSPDFEDSHRTMTRRYGED